ncbi:MAG: histidine phosphatase family protein [Gammaproteobacteria bacterium]|nr:histidine phosphatase family protein [Gammaproteobacteria bacterium]MCP5299664.1 histidine phosphatase family protein [Chromatiaceae bacterium]
MLTLVLLRHGKSDWDAPHDSDHERPLTHRGRDAARAMGKVLARLDQIPDLAVSSSAVRARDTLQFAARAGRWKTTMRTDGALYDSSAADVLVWIKAIDEAPANLLLVGHEPTWSELAGRLIGGEALLRVPTGAMLRIDFDADAWAQIAFGDGELRWLMPPRVATRLLGGK